MVLIERVADQYIEGWNDQSQPRVTKEAASVYLETLHLPETYPYLITPDGLVDPVTGLLVKSFMEKDTPLGKIEYDAFERIEERAINNILQEHIPFTAIWISPSHPRRSEDTKVIFNLVVETEFGPALLNHCLCFEGDKYLSLDIANTILQTVGSFREPFIDTEMLRGTPLLFNKDVNLPTIYEKILQRLQSNGLEELKKGNASRIQEEADRWANTYYDSRFRGKNVVVEKVEAKHSPSCPPGMTASEVIIKNGEVCKFVKRCGNPDCKVEINDFIPKGYKCKSCGQTYLGC